MQLDLFKDNRSGILLNIVDECLRENDFYGAIRFCQQILDEFPDNKQVKIMLSQIIAWLDIVEKIIENFEKQNCFDEANHFLATLQISTFRKAVISHLISMLENMQEPDALFYPPYFHRGYLLMELGRYSEATVSFKNATLISSLPFGRFMVSCADAMVLDAKLDEAIPLYFKAFIEDPDTVDVQKIKHPQIVDVYNNCLNAANEIEDEEVERWMPVWGWFMGVFNMPLKKMPDFDGIENIENESVSKAERWFDLLSFAEYYRTVERDDKQLGIIRRTMKQLQPPMFEYYLLKIQGKFK